MHGQTRFFPTISFLIKHIMYVGYTYIIYIYISGLYFDTYARDHNIMQ